MNSEFTNKILTELKQSNSSFKVVGQLSGMNYIELNVISTCGSPIILDTEIRDLKVRCQSLISGSKFVEGNYRIDNCHKETIHQHFKPSEQKSELSNCILLSDVLQIVLGSEFEEINKKLSKKDE